MNTLALVLVLAGTVLAIGCTLVAVPARSGYARLHCITPITSLAVPLIGAGLSMLNGWSMTTGSIVLVVVLQLVTGSALTAAIGRVTAQRDGIVSGEAPE